MFGNGVAIGMVIIVRHRRGIPPDQPQALTACIVVAVGAALRGTVVWLIVTTGLPTIATTTLGFA